MSNHPKLVAAAALGTLLLTQSCSTAPSRDATAQVKPPEGLSPERKREVEADLRKIAGEYKQYVRVSDDRVGWAPAMCMGPPPPSALRSAAPEPSPHGRKLYFLYARNKDAYLDMCQSGDYATPRTTPYTNPIGQVVVKEAFLPRPADEKQIARYHELEKLVHRFESDTPEAREYARFAQDESGKLFHAGDLSTLFVMLKLDPSTPGTDQGWVYATVDKDLTTITSMGVLESCAACHRKTDRDRLYGKKKTWKQEWFGEGPKKTP